MPHVIMVAPHFPANQRRFVRGLKRVGARVTGVCDSPPEALDSEVRDLLDDFEYTPNVTDANGLYDAVRRVQARGPWVDRLEATIESHMLATAQVREATKIPGLPAEQVLLCRDKFLMKRFLRERGIPCARNAEIDDAEQARAFVGEVGYPVILKPRDGAGAHATYRLDDDEGLGVALHETGLNRGRAGGFTMEEFVEGHEGFFDTLTCNGEVVFEAVTHYYPNVLEAMRTRWISPQMVHTNRVFGGGYEEVRGFGRQVIEALGLTTTATHMEWFYGPKGLSFSEIGARPPGVNHWDMYSEANEFDLYTEWARALVWGDVHHGPSGRYCAGMINLRPSEDGTIVGYSGVEEIQARYGAHIWQSHLPPPGTPTQPIEAGYLANAWIRVKHEDYDATREILNDIGRTIKVWAR